MNNKPLVSIIIPVYNGADFLSAAIESALNQTYPNIEVLVIDDGSNDNAQTATVAESFGNEIRYFKKENGGVSTALNMGIEKMKGDFFSWLSHDDIFLPTKIEKQIDYYSSIGKVCLIYSDYRFIDASGEIINRKKNIASKADRHIFHLFLSYFPINGITTLIPKEIIDEIGLFNVELKTSQDYEFWFRTAKRFPLVFYNEVLAHSRVHEKQGSRTSLSMKFESDELYTRIVRHFFKLRGNLRLNYWSLQECLIFLLKNKYYSAGIMFVRNVDKHIIRVLLYLVFIFFPIRNFIADTYRECKSYVSR